MNDHCCPNWLGDDEDDEDDDLSFLAVANALWAFSLSFFRIGYKYEENWGSK